MAVFVDAEGDAANASHAEVKLVLGAKARELVLQFRVFLAALFAADENVERVNGRTRILLVIRRTAKERNFARWNLKPSA